MGEKDKRGVRGGDLEEVVVDWTKKYSISQSERWIRLLCHEEMVKQANNSGLLQSCDMNRQLPQTPIRSDTRAQE